MDNTAMKSAFAPIIERELLDPISKKLVTQTQEKLENIDFTPQAFARDINLFYINENGRNRIEREGDKFNIVDTNISFTKPEIVAELKENPHNFSPNVILRPLYQEFIFPNLAYIGGGGEIAYWLERKSLFEYYKVFYPVLIRRNSAMIVPSHINKNMDKLNIQITDLLDIEDKVVNNFVYKNAAIELDFSDKKEKIELAFQEIANDAEKIDQTLKPAILAEMSTQVKKIDQIEARVRKVIKQKQEIQINQLTKTYQYLFPNQGLQERHSNIIEFLINENIDIFEILKSNLDPLSNKFKVIYL
jgi:bacillithiol biosynthesis cysteine-adding enzyme BshC